nr:MAG TPA: hypothetical protein [Caudoviricetes sp.]
MQLLKYIPYVPVIGKFDSDFDVKDSNICRYRQIINRILLDNEMC